MYLLRFTQVKNEWRHNLFFSDLWEQTETCGGLTAQLEKQPDVTISLWKAQMIQIYSELKKFLTYNLSPEDSVFYIMVFVGSLFFISEF